MLNQALIVVGLLFTAVCGVPLIEERIYGGSEAKPGQFPYQITLRLWHSSLHYCGGSIISNRHILTAAHCVRPTSPVLDYTVIVGAHSKTGKDGRGYKVARFIQHEGFNETSLQHDVALIELETTIVFNERVSVIRLHRGFIGGQVTAVMSGWGKTNVSQDLFSLFWSNAFPDFKMPSSENIFCECRTTLERKWNTW